MNVSLPWGKDSTIRVEMPSSWEYMGEITPGHTAGLADPREGLLRAMASPVGCGALRSMSLAGKRITVVVDDSSRPTPVHLIFPLLLDELLYAGARKDAITVVVATGTHRPMSTEEIGARLGMSPPFESGGISLANHNARDRGNLVCLGRTAGGMEVWLNRHVAEADLTVLVGTIEPHLMAGFGGGLKNVVPGCAGMATIAATHLEVQGPERCANVGRIGEEVAVRLGLEEAALKAPTRYFLINTVLNLRGEIAGVFCGDPVQAHRKGCGLAAAIYGAPVKGKADVLLVSSHPMDWDLRQATKCLANALGALKDDGILVAFMRCINGVGDMVIPEAYLPPETMRLFAVKCGTRDIVDLRERVTGWPADPDDKYMAQFLCEVFRRHRTLVYAPDIPGDTGERLGTFELYSSIDRLVARVAGLAPASASVMTMPLGGVCYPIFSTDADEEVQG
ncbi:MAG: nickel-dependent lactate racemase [Bacillota bacterium]